MQKIRGRATWTKRLLLAAAAVSAVAIVTDLQEYRDPLRESGFYSTIGSVQLLLLVATAIAFITWLFGAYETLPTLGSAQRFKRWWAIVAWFVPILNLFRPKQIVDDVWKAGHKPRLAVPAYVHVWWAAFLLDSVLSNAAGRLYVRADTAGEVRTAAALYLVSDVLDVAAALLAYRVVEDATSGLERTAALAV